MSHTFIILHFFFSCSAVDVPIRHFGEKMTRGGNGILWKEDMEERAFGRTVNPVSQL
jgi:hypothetical protein